MSQHKLPKQYQRLQERHPALMEAVAGLGKAASESGPLDEKTSQLVQLAAAVAQRAEGAAHSHVRRALAAGASAEEIRHAVILLTSTLGFPNVSAALTWVDDVVEA